MTMAMAMGDHDHGRAGDECGRCGLPLGSRSYELSTTGVDRASVPAGGPADGGDGRPGPRRWTIRHERLCHWCYTAYLEARLAAWPRGKDREDTGR